MAFRGGGARGIGGMFGVMEGVAQSEYYQLALNGMAFI
jgi:hypothetical protein